MPVLEAKRPTGPTPADHPVFVAGDGRRARRLRQSAIVLGVLAALWLVGLGVGMLGFGSLPGLAVVKGVHEDSRPAQASVSLVAQRGNDARSLLSAGVKVVGRGSSPTADARSASVKAGAKRPASARQASRPTRTMPPPTTAQTPANPALRTRGWARKGYAAPRGQLRRIAPPPPPATSRGRRVGQATPTDLPPVAPGQAKKALEPPPPPPPPPPKKG